MTTIIRLLKTKSLLISLLTLFTSFIALYPWWSAGLSEGVFYRIDPDSVYISNAILFIKSQVISYGDHPGTPVITFLSAAFLPIKLYLKFFKQQNFIDWSFFNFDLVGVYSRLICLSIFTAGLFFYLKLVSKVTKSLLAIIFSISLLLIYNSFLPISITVAPEVFSFLLTVLWLFIFSKIDFSNRKRNRPKLFILFLISGFALAVKFTNFGLLLSSSALVLFNPRLKLERRIYGLIYYLSIAAGIFTLSTLPLFSRLRGMLQWGYGFFNHSLKYGGGQETIFDSKDYLNSAKTLFNQETTAGIFYLIILLITLWSVIQRRTRTSNPNLNILIVALLLIFEYAKFPVSHYQITNYLLLTYTSTILLHTYYRRLFTFLTIFILPFVFLGVSNYINSTRLKIEQTAALERQIKQYPPQKGGLWLASKTTEFALVWSKTWSSGVFNEQFDKLKIPMWEISGPDHILESSEFSKELNLFDVCWDRAYIPRRLALQMYEKHQDRGLRYIQLPINDINPELQIDRIESNHCSRSL